MPPHRHSAFSTAVGLYKLLFEHVAAYLRHVNVLGDDFIGTAVEYNPRSPYASYTLYIEVETLRVDVMMVDGRDGPAEPGWVMTFIAKYEGYDGYGDGKHEVRRRVVFKRIDPNVVWNEMMRVVKHAVNALPPEFYVERKI